MLLFYTIIYTAGLIILLPYFLLKELFYPKHFKGIKERLGELPRSINREGKPSIWIHGVSVGEVLAARGLVKRLKERYPDTRLFISATTITGMKMAEKNFEEKNGCFFFPLDIPFVVRRTFSRVKPKMCILMEGELWPNFLATARKRGAKVVLANGRLSTRSFRRHASICPLFHRVLKNIDLFCMQTEEDRRRMIAIGAQPERVMVTGNLKFDSNRLSSPADDTEKLARLLGLLDGKPLLIAGSTGRGEEEIVLRAFVRVKKKHPEAKLLLAPRHPERFDQVEELVKNFSLPYIRRSRIEEKEKSDRSSTIILDTIGELASLYRYGRAVFVGGSLIPKGGHNILEPASCAKPVIFGHHMDNFRAVASMALASGGAIEVKNEEELSQAFLLLIEDDDRCRLMGEASREMVRRNRGTVERTIAAIARLLSQA
jgi:3-deoxy-D-manno-octulosonic-acid transferase